MNKIKSLLIVIAFFTVLYGCTYSTGPTEFTELDENDFGTTIPSLTLSPDIDTLIVPVTTQLQYSIDPVNRELYEVVLLIGNRFVEKNENTSGTFTIDPTEFSTGFHDLTVRAVASTNTGSLADKYDAEALFFDYTWTVGFDNDPPNEIDVTSIEIVDGTLKIDWEEYTRINFQKYKLYRSNDSFITQDLVFETTDPSVTTVTDQTIISGDYEYIIEVTASNYRRTGETQQIEIANVELISIENIDASTVKVTWEKPVLYSNLGQYQLLDRNQNYNSIIWQTFSIDDTTYTFNSLTFGNSYTYLLVAMGSSFTTSGGFEFDVFGGKKIPDSEDFNLNYIRDVIYDPNSDLHLIYHQNGILSYNSNSNVVEASTTLRSSDLFLLQNSIFTSVRYTSPGFSARIAQIDPVTLQVQNYTRVSDMIDGKEDYIFDLKISDSGIAVFNSGYYRSPTTYGDSLIVYDLINEVHLGTFDPGSRALFAGEDFIVVNDSLYRIEPTGLQNLIEFPPDPTSYFDSDNENTVISYQIDYQNGVLVKETLDLVNNNIDLQEISIPFFNGFGTISISDKAVLYIDHQNFFRVFNFESQTIVKSSYVGSDVNSIPIYSNGMLFSVYGYYLD